MVLISARRPVLVSSQLIDAQENGHSLQVMRWGLIPAFVPGDESFKFRTFNARIESLLEKQTYKLSMKACKRCVVVAQGFYEWKTIRAEKQPFYFRPSDPEKLLMMAGLFAYNHEKQMYSYTIITTSSKGIVADVHTRMPVILENDDDICEWLDTTECNPKQVYDFLVNIANNLGNVSVVKYPVTPQVNNSTYNRPDCIEPIKQKEYKPTAKKRGCSSITDFFKQSDDNDESKAQKKNKRDPDSKTTNKIKKEESSQ
ncbi:unnamed protein product [Trichobilharzia szidati]|nr:unnamed protein product [Trichobilharzia szidati]